MSMLFMVDGATSLADDLEGQAWWRGEKAKEYPADTRNLRAAELLDRLAAELRSGAYAAELATLQKAVDEYLDSYVRNETYEDSLSERMSEYMRSVGFHSFPTVSDLLSDLHDMLYEVTAEHAEVRAA